MEDDAKGRGWHYTADGEWPMLACDVLLSPARGDELIVGSLRIQNAKTHLWVGQRDRYGVRSTFPTHQFDAWRELPPKAPRREEQR